jgi:spermidine/putrescine transport system permease protein
MAVSNEARAAAQARLAGFGFTLPAVAWIVLFFGAPLVIMAAYSLLPLTSDGSPPQLGLKAYRDFFGQPAYVQAIWNSVVTTAIVVVLSLLLAYPFAYVLAYRVPKRWQRFALACAILPFWTSYVVRSYSWLLVLAENGVVNKALTGSGLADAPLQLANTRTATVIGFVHFFVMLLTLTIFANLKQLSPSYRRAAADLGAGPVRTFWHIILPLTLPGIVVGAFLTFVLAIGDYITPQILGGNNELLMPQLIMMQIGRRGDFPLASALAIILMAVVTLAYLFCARWLKIERA